MKAQDINIKTFAEFLKESNNSIKDNPNDEDEGECEEEDEEDNDDSNNQ